MELRLIVIRTEVPQRLAEFYALLGLSFAYHKHGSGPYHYTASMGKTVLEIYPLAKDQSEADPNLRLGFSLDHFEITMSILRKQKVTFVSEPAETEYGFMCVIRDPDGRKIALYQQ